MVFFVNFKCNVICNLLCLLLVWYKVELNRFEEYKNIVSE